MSAWSNLAESIKTRLESLQLLDGVSVIVDKQKNAEALISTNIAKSKGLCITILMMSSDFVADSGGRDSVPTYLIKAWGPATMKAGMVALDDAMEAILPALTGWHPDERAAYGDKLQPFGPMQLVPETNAMTYEQIFTGRVLLPTPTFKS